MDYEGIKNFRRIQPGISMADALGEFSRGFSCEIHHPVTLFVYAAREFGWREHTSSLLSGIQKLCARVCSFTSGREATYSRRKLCKEIWP